MASGCAHPFSPGMHAPWWRLRTGCTLVAMSAEAATPDVAVIVVDDQSSFRRAAAAVVAATDGFVVAGEADSADAAFALIRLGGPTLVLMDINMPGVGGIEATRRIHADRPDVVVLLMSTYDPMDLPAHAADCGAAGYVHKELLEPQILTRTWHGAPIGNNG